jgi:hypothetical protein
VPEETLTLARDALVNVEASSTRPMPGWLAGDYLTYHRDPTTGKYFCPNADGTGAVIPFAVTNPVLVDVDGDGRFRAKLQPAAMPDRPDVISPADLGGEDCFPGARLPGPVRP